MNHKINLSITVLILISILSCVSSTNVEAKRSKSKSGESMRDEAKGTATIFDDDISLARDRAIDDARNKLVQKVLGATIEGRQIMEDFRLVESEVTEESYGLVKKEKIKSEGSEGNLYYVVIEGTVEPAVVKDAIGDALNRYGNPTFMALVVEEFQGSRKYPGDTITDWFIENKFMNELGKSGFKFVDPGRTRQLMKNERAKMMSAIQGQMRDDVMELLLEDVGADVVIVGRTRFTDITAQARQLLSQGYGATSRSRYIQANVDLKAIDVYTGNILATATVPTAGKGIHINPEEAMRQAVEKTLGMSRLLGRTNEMTNEFEPGTFINNIIRKFVRAATHRQINVTVTGLDYANLKKFRSNLEFRVRGVKEVQLKGQSGTAAKLEIYFSGKTEAFLDRLTAKADKMKFDIKVVRTWPNKVILQATRLGD